MEAATSIVCPACSFEQAGGTETCARCGVIFAKLQDRARRLERAGTTLVARTIPDPAGPPGKAWKLLAGGLVAAAVVHVMPFLSFVLSPLVTLLHEFGHAVAAWFLGCPAIPAFDFVYGGGVTHQKNFQWPLAILIGGGWAWLGWTFRRNPRTLVLIGVFAVVWLYTVSSPMRREIVISALGHGGELILAATLLYMAMSGVGWRIPEIERPLGAFAAFFVQFQTMHFAWRLRHDPVYLEWYREGKGGALMNDLEVIALDIRIRTGWPLDIEQTAGWLLVFSVITLATSILLFVFRKRVNAFGRSLLRIDPD